ncbi:MAG: hypothetical protein QNL91_07000 [Candidatus Krumholzibacteria bacterium]|nr:hypothetical protein [Candidatus Krumholzibacteria bacterium]
MKVFSIAIIVGLLFSSQATAASGAGAINMSFNTSARFEAMGSAGVGAPWGTDTNHWANPALLAFRPGLNYLKFRSELAVGLADDIVITNEEITLGNYGVTLLLATGPVDGNFLDMGTQIGTDENGIPTASFESYMKSESWGLGLDVVQILDRLLDHGDQSWSRYTTLAVGYTHHDFSDQLAPDNNLQDSQGGGSAEGSSSDKGFVLRATPLVIDTPNGWHNNGYVGLTAGAAYGYSLQSDTDKYIVHVNTDQSDPFPRAFIKGWSVHLALPLAPNFRDRPVQGLERLLTEAIDPFFSFTYSSQLIEPGYVWNQDLGDYVYEHDKSGLQDEEGHGWEIGLANIFYVRRGHVKVDYGQVDGDTSGWGINLQAGDMGGFRFDRARVPQAIGLPNVTREGWSIWICPLAIANR